MLSHTEVGPETLQESFEKTAMIHRDELFAAAIRYTKNEKDAEDLVQETFLKAYKNFHRFEMGTNCRAWLFTIQTNTFINRFRRKKKEREILHSESNQDVFDHFQTVDEGPERSITERALSQDMKNALAALPGEFRSVVVLADLNDFSYKEVAHILECPVGTVMSRLFRGRKMMRRQLLDVAFENGIIRDKAPYLHDESNRTRRSVRVARMEALEIDAVDLAS